MKKILPITLLAVAALFVLSSCDSMLEALFPKDTVGVDTGNNTITFQIYGTDYNYNFSHYGFSGTWDYQDPSSGAWIHTFANGQIHVEVYDNSSSTVPVDTQTTFFAGNSFGSDALRTASVTFVALKDGNYTFKVWYDAKPDGVPDLELNDYNYWYFTRSALTTDTEYVSSQYVEGDETVTLYVDLFEYPSPFVS